MVGLKIWHYELQKTRYTEQKISIGKNRAMNFHSRYSNNVFILMI